MESETRIRANAVTFDNVGKRMFKVQKNFSGNVLDVDFARRKTGRVVSKLQSIPNRIHSFTAVTQEKEKG